MECNKIEKYLKEKDCIDNTVPEELQQHLAQCKDCHNYYQFVLALNLQKGSIEKAPEDILPNIEKKILNSINSKNRKPFTLFKPLLKPSFAVSFILLVAILSYLYLANKNIGYVENLSERFKIAQFENIKSGDVLYAGDNTIATVRLKNDNKLQIHQNTIVRVKGSRRLSLSRGEISLLSGDKELQIETPDGLLLARNTKTKIATTVRLEKGVLKTETTCCVFNGKLIIKYPSKEVILNQGQKIVLAENGRITYQQQMTTTESESEKNNIVKQKLLAAVESLCDCIHADNYVPGKKSNHLQLFGKEVNENKFKVRVFWPEKGLHGLVFGPINEKNTKYSIKIRRVHA
jgi:hypothetical protein